MADEQTNEQNVNEVVETEEAEESKKNQDNPFLADIRINDTTRAVGELRFAEPFTFNHWRAWRRVVGNKKLTQRLKKGGSDSGETETMIAYWSGASIIDTWDVYIETDGERVTPISRPEVGEHPDENMPFSVFQWFRRCANDYILPRLGFSPN